MYAPCNAVTCAGVTAYVQTCNAPCNAPCNAHVTPPPTRPDPTRPVTTNYPRRDSSSCRHLRNTRTDHDEMMAYGTFGWRVAI